MSNKILFHGSKEVVKIPEIRPAKYNKDFYYGFKKIGYDLIDNMVKWTEKEKCFNSIKYNLEIVKKRIIYDYQCDDTIREDFNTLYRHIIISKFV